MKRAFTTNILLHILFADSFVLAFFSQILALFLKNDRIIFIVYSLLNHKAIAAKALLYREIQIKKRYAIIPFHLNYLFPSSYTYKTCAFLLKHSEASCNKKVFQ